jgi:hypothetical protein
VNKLVQVQVNLYQKIQFDLDQFKIAWQNKKHKSDKTGTGIAKPVP